MKKQQGLILVTSLRDERFLFVSVLLDFMALLTED